MIVADRKPIDEIKTLVAPHKKILVLGCGTCVTVCLAGGERETAVLASILRLGVKAEFAENTIERQCDAEFFDSIREQLESCDAVLSMACGVGVQVRPAVAAARTVFAAADRERRRQRKRGRACAPLHVP